MKVFRFFRRGVGLLVVMALIAPSAGCGYALTGRGSFLPAYIRTIGVPLFANRTKVPDVEIQITERVRGEFLGRGRYEIRPTGDNADAVLTGEVLSVTVDPSSFTADQIASRYIITMTARVELRDTRANAVLWEDPRLTFRQEYDAQSGTGVLDPSAFFAQDAAALERIANDFARTIVSAILEAF
jgi:Lipopolysaccharide-assembly